MDGNVKMKRFHVNPSPVDPSPNGSVHFLKVDLSPIINSIDALGIHTIKLLNINTENKLSYSFLHVYTFSESLQYK